MKYKNILWWLPVILWMIFILSLSSDTGIESKDKSDAVLNFLNINHEAYIKYIISFIIRKSAHVFNYSILSILTFFAIKKTLIVSYLKKIIVYAYLICFVFAIIDEIFQTYIPGRGGQFQDVLIDSLGIIIGIYIFVKFKLYKKT